MALHRNLWGPDTCGCEIEFEFDDELPEASRVHTAATIIKTCPAHSTIDIVDKHDHYDTVLKENQRKNIVHGQIMEQFPHLVDDKGDKGKSLKEGINYKFEFQGTGKNRTLNIELEGANLSTADKKKIKDLSDTTFGNGKVTIK